MRLISHVKGQPEHVMQKIIENNHIDVLVMGTVARTGIPDSMQLNNSVAPY